MKDIGTQMRDEFFFKRFNELYKERWKSKGKTQLDFAKAIRAQFPNPDKCKCDNNLVSKWLTKKAYPVIYLPQIAKVLGVAEEEFAPQTHSERYEYDPEYIERALTEKDKYRQTIGLKRSFIRYIRSTKSLSKSFPLYSPLYHKYDGLDECGFTISKYVRMGFANASKTEKENPLYLIEKDEKTILLNNADLQFLKEVQDKVDEYVEFLFARRAREMREEEETATKLCTQKTKSGGIAYCAVPYEKLLEIDRFLKYVSEEGKK